MAAREYLNSNNDYNQSKIEMLHGMVNQCIFILEGIQSGQFNMEQAQVHAEKMRLSLYRMRK